MPHCSAVPFILPNFLYIGGFQNASQARQQFSLTHFGEIVFETKDVSFHNYYVIITYNQLNNPISHNSQFIFKLP